MLTRCSHVFGLEGGIHRVKQIKVDALMRKILIKGSIIDLTTSWNRHVLSFSFKLKKAIFTYTINGTITVEAKVILVEYKLPWQVDLFIDEKYPESMVGELTRQLNSAKPL